MKERRKSDEKNVKKNITVDRNISVLIGTLRAYLGLSQAVFAEPLNLSPTHIARFEKGVSVPSKEIINTICDAFEVDHRYFEEDMSVEEAVKKKIPGEGVAERLKAARRQKGLTQVELAEKSGVLQSVISRVEFGDKLTIKQGVKLAEALEVGIDWLMLGDEKKKEYPADKKMIDWLWEHSDVRKEIWDRMNEEKNQDE